MGCETTKPPALSQGRAGLALSGIFGEGGANSTAVACNDRSFMGWHGCPDNLMITGATT